MVLIYFIAKTSLTVIDSRCKYPRKLIHQFFLLLYTISKSNLSRQLRLFSWSLYLILSASILNFEECSHLTILNLHGDIFVDLVGYYHFRTKMTIQLRNKNGRSKSILYVDIFFSLSMIVFSGVFISLVLLDLSNSTISV